MNKIDYNTRQAVNYGNSMKQGNTRVEISNDDFKVFLHNNLIAFGRTKNNGRFNPLPVIETVRKWPTQTTIRRLRAIGIDIHTSKGKIFWNGVEV